MTEDDIVERLRDAAPIPAGLYTEAADEIERLRAALTYEENRSGRIGTHGPDCYRWGPSHYECALREIERLRAELDDATLEQAWAERNAAVAELHNYKEVSQAREAKLRQAFEVLWIGTDRKTWDGKALEFFKYVFDMEPDDTALQEVIKQAKREALMEALTCTTDEIRRMAGELK